MKRARDRILLITLLGALAAQACRQQATAPTCGRPEDLFRDIDGIGDYSTRMGVLRAMHIRPGVDTGSGEGQTLVTGSFVNGYGCMVDAGAVAFNGIEIQKSKVLPPSGRIPSIAYLQQGAALAFDGNVNTFTVAGGAEIGGMTLTIPSPIEETTITSPLGGDTIVRGSAVTIRWDPGLADTVLIGVASMPDSRGISRGTFVPNTGACTMTADVFASLPDGPVTITVNRINYRVYRELGWGTRNVLVTICSVQRIEVRLR